MPAVVVAEHRALDLAAVDPRSMSTFASQRQRRRESGVERRRSVLAHPRHAQRRSQAGRLDEERVPERAGGAAHRVGIGPPLARGDDGVGDDGDAGVAQQALADVLVHADGGGEHADADVGHVEGVEQSLHGAVLTVGSVQHRKNDVEVGEGVERLAWVESPHRPARGTGTTARPAVGGTSASMAQYSSSASRCQPPARSIPTRTG
jgi:hypothetical protein